MVVVIFPSSPPFSLLLSLLFLLVPSSFPSPPSCPPQLRGLKHGPARRDDPGELKGMSQASGEEVLVYGGSDKVAVCPAPVPQYWDSEEFWFILKWVVIVVTATVFCLGCCCGCYFKSFCNKILFKGAVNPAPRDTGVLALRADVERKTVQNKGAMHKLLNTFTVVDLRVVLKAKSLAVSGLKDDLITRLIKHGSVLSDCQAKEIEQLRVMATARGPLVKLNLQDISSPEAAQNWIETINWRT